jgi:hypothetical protein
MGHSVMGPKEHKAKALLAKRKHVQLFHRNPLKSWFCSYIMAHCQTHRLKGSNLTMKIMKYNIWSLAVYGAEIWTLRKVDQKEVPWKFWGVVLEKDEDQSGRQCKKWRYVLQRIKE